MNHLAMNTHCLEGTVRVVTDPPLVAVGIARLIIPPRRLERLPVGPLTDSADHLGTDYLMTIELAFQTHHLGKAGQITQGNVEAGARPFRALGIQQHVAILLGTQLAPDPLFDQDRKSTRLNSSHVRNSYAVFCLKKKNNTIPLVTHL